jgi:hypothetical protein
VLAIEHDLCACGLQNASDELREFTIAKHCSIPKFVKWNLIQDLAGSSERFDENCLFVRHVRGNYVEIFEREREIFREGSIMGHDAQHGAAGAVSFQSATTKFANWPEVVRRAGNIDFAGDAFACPALSLGGGSTCDLDDFSYKFVAGHSVKLMVATQDFNVCVTDSAETNANQGPARPQFRQGAVNFAQSSIFDDEAEHKDLFFRFFGQGTTGGHGHPFDQFKLRFQAV